MKFNRADLNNIKVLEEKLDDIVILLNSKYHDIWRRVYPVLGMNYKRGLDNNLLNRISKSKEIILYIHVPFCINKCDYCTYFGVCDIKRIGSKNYVKCLIEELKNILKVNNDRILLSLFFGGGTPNMLAPKDFRRLMHFIKTNFIFSPDAHLSLEASPTIFSQEFAEILAEYEFTRICLGVQTFNENKLIYINRRFQKNRDVYRAVKFLKNVGFHNYCFDMIYGLSLGETANDFLKDNLKHIVKLQPIKVDLYALQHYKKFPETIRNFPSENMDIIKKKINHYLYRFKSKKLKIPTIGFDTNKLTAEHSQYFYLRRILLKDTIAIGLGGVGNYWVENKYLKVKSQEMHAWREYMSRALNGKISYKYYVLDPEEAIRKYIHYGLHTWYGIREDVIHNTFPEYIDTFQDIITQAKHTLKFVNNKILLRSDFEKRLPLKTRNEFVNYFIFAYCYLYSEKNQKEFLSRALSLLD